MRPENFLLAFLRQEKGPHFDYAAWAGVVHSHFFFWFQFVKYSARIQSQLSESNFPLRILAKHFNDKSSSVDMPAAEEDAGGARAEHLLLLLLLLLLDLLLLLLLLLVLLLVLYLNAFVVVASQLPIRVRIGWDGEHNIVRTSSSWRWWGWSCNCSCSSHRVTLKQQKKKKK